MNFFALFAYLQSGIYFITTRFRADKHRVITKRATEITPLRKNNCRQTSGIIQGAEFLQTADYHKQVTNNKIKCYLLPAIYYMFYLQSQTLKVLRFAYSACLPSFHWLTGRKYPDTRL